MTSYVAASPPTEYIVSLPAPQTQTVEMSMVVRDIRSDSLDVALPTWRPGRYVILDPAGTIRQIRAFNDRNDASLTMNKTDKSTWNIDTNGAQEIRIEYTIYANSLNDRTRHVDDTHAFLSPSSVFLYAPIRRTDEIIVHIDAPKKWRTATGLEPHPTAANTFIAPNYDVLVDSPLEIGIHDVIHFDVDGVPHEIVIWGEADYDADQLIEDFSKIVHAQAIIFDEMPYDRYVFLLHVAPGIGGGTEHLNSTIMQTSRRSLEDDTSYKRFLGLVSHEFFHTWNVKQLRPAGIVPYQYDRENYSKLFWVSEGTTSYYDDLVLARTSLIKPDKYLKVLSDAINSLRNTPGRLVQSLEDSSFDAWIKFNKRTSDSTNSTISFYSKGALVSLMLDMDIRSRTDNEVSLDDIMRELYERFPLDDGGFTPDDLIETIEDETGSSFDAFFDANVRGTVELDLETTLSIVGLELFFKPAPDDDAEDDDDDDSDNNAADDDEPAPVKEKAYLGLRLRDSSGRAMVRTVLTDGPANDANVMVGDEIVAMNGRRLRAGDIDKRLKKIDPGETISLTLFRRDALRTIEIVAASQPAGKWTVRRLKEPTEDQINIYESWIKQPWPERDDEDSNENDSDHADE